MKLYYLNVKTVANPEWHRVGPRVTKKLCQYGLLWAIRSKAVQDYVTGVRMEEA
jgi:hypothetical protein